MSEGTFYICDVCKKEAKRKTTRWVPLTLCLPPHNDEDWIELDLCPICAPVTTVAELVKGARKLRRESE